MKKKKRKESIHTFNKTKINPRPLHGCSTHGCALPLLVCLADSHTLTSPQTSHVNASFVVSS